MAEIVQQRRSHAAPRETGAVLKNTEAIDPICGMSVAVATARHSAQVKGRTYYFCCAGCRSKFLQKEETR
jgi:YHS domain-containing protein